MHSIGITGGIGTGKTTVCKIFQHNWNIPVYYADDSAKWFMDNDTETRFFISTLFGRNIYKNNILKKEIVAEIIFNNKQIKEEFEQFIHNKVIIDYLNWRKKQYSPYNLHESALIFEAQYSNYFDKIILVLSPMELRLKRLQKKGISKSQALLRIENQLSDEEKANNADFIIYNNNNNSLIEQIISIHNKIMKNL